MRSSAEIRDYVSDHARIGSNDLWHDTQFWRDRWCGKSSHNYMGSAVYVRYPLDVWLFAQAVDLINGEC